MSEDIDRTEEMESKETRNKLPMGWLILFFGLILWGIYYFAAYSPSISGWTQSGAYEQAVEKK